MKIAGVVLAPPFIANYRGSLGSDISASVLPSVSSKSASHTSRSARVAILCGSVRNAMPRDANESRIC